VLERAFSEWADRAKRRPSRLAGAAYRADGTWVRVRLTNLSYDGCLLVCETPLSVGEIVKLVMPKAGKAEAQVRWAKARNTASDSSNRVQWKNSEVAWPPGQRAKSAGDNAASPDRPLSNLSRPSAYAPSYHTD